MSFSLFFRNRFLSFDTLAIGCVFHMCKCGGSGLGERKRRRNTGQDRFSEKDLEYLLKRFSIFLFTCVSKNHAGLKIRKTQKILGAIY